MSVGSRGRPEAWGRARSALLSEVRIARGKQGPGRGQGKRAAEWSRLSDYEGKVGPGGADLPRQGGLSYKGSHREATQPHLALLLTSARASSLASAWLGKTAASPNFTSMTKADRFSTTFLLRIEAWGWKGEGLDVKESLEFSKDSRVRGSRPYDGGGRAWYVCASLVTLGLVRHPVMRGHYSWGWGRLHSHLMRRP